MAKLVCPNCFDTYCEPGERLCPSCAAARGRYSTPPPKPEHATAVDYPRQPLPDSLAGYKLSDFA